MPGILKKKGPGSYKPPGPNLYASSGHQDQNQSEHQKLTAQAAIGTRNSATTNAQTGYTIKV